MPKQENIIQEQKTPFAQIQEKDKADFLAKIERMKAIEDEEEMKTAIGDVVSSALKFFENYPDDEQAFSFLMKKIDILKMSCDSNVFDRAFSQEQVDELINLICENKKDEKSQHVEYFAYGLFSTNQKAKDEVDTISDQTAIALTRKLQNGETIKGAMTKELSTWLQHSQMIADGPKLELICAILNNPGHINDGVSYALIAGQADFGGVMLERMVEQAEDRELNVTMKVLDVLEALARLGKWDDLMEAGRQRAFEQLEKMQTIENNYFVKTRLKLIADKLENFFRNSRVKPENDLAEHKAKISPLSAQFYDKPENFIKEFNYNKISKDYGVIYNGREQVDSFFKLNAENGTNLELKDILANSHTQWETLTQEQQQNLTDNYRVLINPDFRFEIEQKFKIQLKDFDIRTQVQFLNFIADNNEDEIERVVSFINSNEDREITAMKLQAFLALEVKDAEGAKILQVGEKLSEEKAKLFFQKISELAVLAAKERSELQGLLLKEEREKEIPKIQQELLKRAYVLVEKFSDELSQEQSDDRKVETLLADLEKSKTEIILLAAALKNGVTLEQLEGWEILVKENPDEKEQEEMVAITERNWDQIKNIKDVVVGGFQGIFIDGIRRKRYLAKFQEKMVSFLPFKQTFPGKLYAGSFNVDFDTRGLGIGNFMMERAIMEEAKENIIEATVSPRISAGTAYVERVGFVIDGIISNYQKTSEPLFSIELDNKKNLTYQYRNEGKEVEMSEDSIKGKVSAQVEAEQLIGAESFVLKFDMENDFENMKATMEKLLVAKDDNDEEIAEQTKENKYIITRYFKDKTQPGKDVRYFVFEAIKD